MPGPVGKRSDAKHGHRTRAELAGVEKAPGGAAVRWPRADPEWHPVAKDFYASLRKSGQAQYYEQSDVALAVYVTEAMSRNLSGKFSAVLFAAVISAAGDLLATEGARRRLRVELQKEADDAPQAELKILDDYREMMR